MNPDDEFTEEDTSVDVPDSKVSENAPRFFGAHSHASCCLENTTHTQKVPLQLFGSPAYHNNVIDEVMSNDEY